MYTQRGTLTWQHHRKNEKHAEKRREDHRARYERR